MDRKLSTIQVIKDVKSVTNSDFLDVVTVKGWQVVAKRNEFKVGDKCVYFEVDSFLPICPEFEFLRKSCYAKMDDKEGFRLRTVKLRGQLSQGLVIPLTDFQTNYSSFGILDLSKYSIGECLDEQLGVSKYEKPLPSSISGDIKAHFPYFLKKTDQERIQNCYDDIIRMGDDFIFEKTLKLDGTSYTIYHLNGDIGVCSRNYELHETETNVHWQITRKLRLPEILKKCGFNYALQGELMGVGIQGNKEKFKELELFIYDIWNIDEQRYLTYIERTEFCKRYKLQHVPILDNEAKDLHLKTLDDLLEDAKGKSINANIREGVVYKELNGRFSFKVINNDWLLKHKD